MPAAPFYGYFQTPMRAAVPNPPHTSSKKGQASSSSAGQNWNWLKLKIFTQIFVFYKPMSIDLKC